MEFYEKSTSQLENRLNIVDHLQTQGKNSILHNAILQPYQVKLLPYISEKNGSEAVKMGEHQKKENLSLLEALQTVKSQEKKSELNKMIDEWIYDNLDEEVKLIDAIELMKSFAETDAKDNATNIQKSTNFIGKSVELNKNATTQNILVRGYESLRNKEDID